MKTLESPFERDIPGKPNLPYFDQSVAYARIQVLGLQVTQHIGTLRADHVPVITSR